MEEIQQELPLPLVASEWQSPAQGSAQEHQVGRRQAASPLQEAPSTGLQAAPPGIEQCYAINLAAVGECSGPAVQCSSHRPCVSAWKIASGRERLRFYFLTSLGGWQHRPSHLGQEGRWGFFGEGPGLSSL